jgi:hypothetical protein
MKISIVIQVEDGADLIERILRIADSLNVTGVRIEPTELPKPKPKPLSFEDIPPAPVDPAPHGRRRHQPTASSLKRRRKGAPDPLA